MISLALLALLSQYPRFGQGQSRDGGVAWPVECTNCGSSSVVTVDGGTVAISNFPAMQPVSGTVIVSGYVPPDGGVNVNNFPNSQAVTGVFWPNLQVVLIDAGTVSVASLPAVVIDGGVNISALPAVVIDGGVNVSNFPAMWPNLQWVSIDGGIAVTNLPANLLTDGGVVNVGNFPASQAVTGTFWPNAQVVTIDSGTVDARVTNFPATQAVSIASMPSTPVTGTFWQSTQPVSLASAPTTAVTLAAGAISGSNPCQNSTATINGISGSTSGTAAVQLVALSGSTKIYLCGLTVTGVSGTTPTFSLVTGTGSNCGTGQAVLIGAWTTTASTVYSFNASTVAIGPAGAALCYLDTGTTPVQRYTLTYAQQ